MTPFDLTTGTDDDWADIYRLHADHRTQAAPAESITTEADYRARLSCLPPSERPAAWAHRAPTGHIVAFAWAVLRSTSTVWVSDLIVAPEHRRQGHGRALFRLIKGYAESNGCRTVAGSVLTEPGRAFVAALGGRESNRSRRSVWRPPLDPDLRRDLPDGYHLRSWIGGAPDDLLDSFVRARAAINDAPRDAAIAPDLWTPDRLREVEQAAAERGNEVRVTAALTADGTVAGFTDLRVAGTQAKVDDTAVLADHRNRGLAHAVKYESLRLLVADHPTVTTVSTSNDATNTAMIAVNTKLGFTETAIWTHVLVAV
ncbi:GNAT family N-acetyltransferase [Hamadaea sp. NPDC050747]|uniref:GNAT family N-acetyltransferase n=1 Tax=Hamadaea sp. NPDC050747 TaxID=3155789 RepID=UPI00340AAAA6